MTSPRCPGVKIKCRIDLRAATHQLQRFDVALDVELLLRELRLQTLNVSVERDLRLHVPLLDQRGRRDGLHLQLSDGVVLLRQDVLQLPLIDLDSDQGRVRTKIKLR